LRLFSSYFWYYNRAFRRVALGPAALGVEFVFGLGAFDAPDAGERQVFGVFAAAGIVGLIFLLPRLFHTAPPVGSAEWARSRIRKLCIVPQRLSTFNVQYLLIDSFEDEIVSTHALMSAAMAERDRLDPVQRTPRT